MFFDSLADLFGTNEDSNHKPEQELGEWFYQLINENIYIERSGFIYEQVQSIAQRLNQVRSDSEPINPVIIWIPQVNAFIMPGDYLYISRELLQCLTSDDDIAFILAHEMSHYELGHIRPFQSYLSHLKRLPSGDTIALLLLKAKLTLFQQEREQEADELALELCLKAGYDGYRCLKFFDIMEAHYLDFGNFDEVLGTTEDYSNYLLNELLNPILKQMKKATTSHADLRSRKQYLLDRLSNR